MAVPSSDPVRRSAPSLRRRARVLMFLGACFVVLALAPGSALAHDAAGLGGGDQPSDPDLSMAMDEAQVLASLPPERANDTCGATKLAPGLGPACRTDDGLFRV